MTPDSYDTDDRQFKKKKNLADFMTKIIFKKNRKIQYTVLALLQIINSHLHYHRDNSSVIKITTHEKLSLCRTDGTVSLKTKQAENVNL